MVSTADANGTPHPQRYDESTQMANSASSFDLDYNATPVTRRELVLWGFAALTKLSRHYTRFHGADAPSKYTVFHSAVEPNVPIPEYVLRLDRHLDIGDEALLLTLVLIGRYTTMTGLLPSAQSMHRLILAAARVVTKAVHDLSRKTSTFARVGGVVASELGQLEVFLLKSVDFAVFFEQRDLDHLVRELHESQRSLTLEDALLAAARGMRLPMPKFHVAEHSHVDDRLSPDTNRPVCCAPPCIDGGCHRSVTVAPV